MHIFPATLETMVECGHSWEAVSFLMLVASVCGSIAHTESGGMSLGNSTSRNYPGQTVVDVGGEHSTMAQCAVGLTFTGCWDPYLWIVPSLRITWCLAGRTVISLDSTKKVPARTSTQDFR